MEAYRDQYATLFNNGDRVVVLAVSVDPDTTLARWAERAHFPMLFAADTQGIVGKRYGAYQPARHMNNRTLYVIAPDGRITFVARPFNALYSGSYVALAEAVTHASSSRVQSP